MGSGSNEPLQSTNTAMGTIVSQTIYLMQPDDVKVTDDILQIITDLEHDILSWRLESAEVYKINALAGSQTDIPLTERMSFILKKCMEVSEASEGTFDITIGEVVRLWDIDSWAGGENVTEYILPTDEQIKNSLIHTGYEKLLLQENTLILPAQMQLDLGAVGKGIALDTLREYLDGKSDVEGAIVSVGGSVLTYGTKPNHEPWRVAVINPQDSSTNLGYLELQGTWCVSTSGDYERYVEIDGVRYHHIIDPSTGCPADGGIAGVTILSKDGLLSDALSTACFILGAEKGKELAEQFDAEALFVDRDGKITMTEGMEQFFRQ